MVTPVGPATSARPAPSKSHAFFDLGIRVGPGGAAAPAAAAAATAGNANATLTRGPGGSLGGGSTAADFARITSPASKSSVINARRPSRIRPQTVLDSTPAASNSGWAAI